MRGGAVGMGRWEGRMEGGHTYWGRLTLCFDSFNIRWIRGTQVNNDIKIFKFSVGYSMLVARMVGLYYLSDLVYLCLGYHYDLPKPINTNGKGIMGHANFIPII